MPKIISYGEHPDTPHALVSILMTRTPGRDLGDPELYEDMTEDERGSVFAELQCILQTMRKWSPPWDEGRICSVLGTAVRSVRVPDHAVRPCASESEFTDHLFNSISSHSFDSTEKFKDRLETAEKLRKMRNPIVCTHGDLKHHNIMVLNGHISGFLDWESAGWHPDYWEFTTPLRVEPRDLWWNDMVWRLGGERYAVELESEKALVPLTVDAWAW